MMAFFKNNKREENNNNAEFLDIESSIYNTEGENTGFQDNVNYQNLVYTSPLTTDVPKYKAVRSNIGVVIDKDQFGYNLEDFHNDIKTYELEKNNSEETLEINMEVVEQPENVNNPIEELVLDKEINLASTIEVPVINNVINKESKVEDEFSIFGSKNNDIKELKHEVTDYVDEKPELIDDIKMTENGYKICPNCGAILNPDAPVCFMCSKSFIKK